MYITFKMKKIEFTALEIGSGYAFLLEDNDMNILFDSGGSKTTIVRVLKKKKIYNVHLAICSHNDIDHANGFIGLLDSDISIGEIWLPVTWASILDFIIDNKRVLFELRRYIAKNSVEINDEIKPQIDGLYSKESISVEDFDERLSYISELIEIYNFTDDPFFRLFPASGEVLATSPTGTSFDETLSCSSETLNPASCNSLTASL